MERIDKNAVVPQWELVVADVWAPEPIAIPAALWTLVDQWVWVGSAGFDAYRARYSTIVSQDTITGGDLMAEFASRGVTFGELSRPAPGETEKIAFYLDKITRGGSDVASKAGELLEKAVAATGRGLDAGAWILDNLGFILLAAGVLAAGWLYVEAAKS